MKHAIEYTTVNPVYAEGRAMCKIALVVAVVILFLSML